MPQEHFSKPELVRCEWAVETSTASAQVPCSKCGEPVVSVQLASAQAPACPRCFALAEELKEGAARGFRFGV